MARTTHCKAGVNRSTKKEYGHNQASFSCPLVQNKSSPSRNFTCAPFRVHPTLHSHSRVIFKGSLRSQLSVLLHSSHSPCQTLWCFWSSVFRGQQTRSTYLAEVEGLHTVRHHAMRAVPSRSYTASWWLPTHRGHWLGLTGAAQDAWKILEA